jgi:hypothetical protein
VPNRKKPPTGSASLPTAVFTLGSFTDAYESTKLFALLGV